MKNYVCIIIASSHKNAVFRVKWYRAEEVETLCDRTTILYCTYFAYVVVPSISVVSVIYRFYVCLSKVMRNVIKWHKPDLPRVKLVALLVTVLSDCAGVKSGDSRLKFPGLDTVTKLTLFRISMLQKQVTLE